MNLDQIKKDLEEFKAWQEKCRSLVLFDHPLDAYRPEDLIVKHLEKLIIKNEEIWELRREETSINIGLINKLSKAEEVIRFYANKDEYYTQTSGGNRLDLILAQGEVLKDKGQKAKEYFEKGKHNV